MFFSTGHDVAKGGCYMCLSLCLWCFMDNIIGGMGRLVPVVMV
jgi:hypothetical protein